MSWSRFVPYSPSLHTVTLLSFYRFFVSINLFPWSRDDSGFVYFPFYSGVADFTSSFVSVYFISFNLLVVCGISLFVPFYFSYTVFVGIQFGRFLRAGLSSNGSSESYSDSLPGCAPIKSLAVLSLRVPLQLKGCTRSPTMCSTTTPSGASVLQVHSAL